MKKINHIIISLLTIISLTACDSKDEYYINDKDLPTPNVKELGIKPIARYDYSYIEENSATTETYRYRYSKDNRLNKLEGQKWTSVMSPLCFKKNGGKSQITNFKLNNYGCATYYELRVSDVLNTEYHITYDEQNRISTIKTIAHIGGYAETEYKYTRDIDGRINSILTYSNNKCIGTITFSYASPATKNNTGLFLENILNEYPFLAATGLLGCPSPYLPQKCITTEASKKGTISMSATYEYSKKDNYIIQIIEKWKWDNLSWIYIHDFTYKGLYLNDTDDNQKPLGERKCIGSPVMG